MAYYQQQSMRSSPSVQGYENHYNQPPQPPVSQTLRSDAAYKEADATQIACSLQSPQNFRRLAWVLGIIVGMAVIMFFMCGVRASRAKSQIIDTRNKVCPNVRLSYRTCEDDFYTAYKTARQTNALAWVAFVLGLILLFAIVFGFSRKCSPQPK